MNEQAAVIDRRAEPRIVPRDVGRVSRLAHPRALWALSLLVLFAGAGNPPVTRTQEARVLETGRQMSVNGGRNWLIPHLNGRPRLQKPPLAYWLAAASYAIFGVSEAAGRAPFVLAAWLTLGLTYDAGRRLGGQRAGVLAAGALMGSLLFARYARLAETDAIATLSVTSAVLSLWRSFEQNTAPARQFHLAAAAMGVAAMSKGAPAIFPLLFLLLVATVERKWGHAWRFVRCGAPLTFLLVAAPWYVAVGVDQGWATFARELFNTYEGGDHRGSPLAYVAPLVASTAPWTALAVLAPVAAAQRWHSDPRLRAALLWCAAILLPLCVAGSKQRHYLLTLMPPVMALVGWCIDWGLRGPAEGDPRRRRLVLGVLALSVAGTLAAGVAMPAALRVVQGGWHRHDLTAGAVIAGTAGAALWVLHRRGGEAGSLMAIGAAAVVLPLLVTWWAPTTDPNSPRFAARAADETFGDAPLRFYGMGQNLAFCFYLRREIPGPLRDEDVTAAASELPGLVLVSTGNLESPPPAPPAPFVKRLELRAGESLLTFFARPSHPAAAAMR